MTEPRYTLSISFKSNEAPWSMNYEPYPVDKYKNDEDALDWLRGMRDGAGPDYNMTLLRDGIVVPEPRED